MPFANEHAAVVVLIDDVRSFRDRRACAVARTSTDGIGLLSSLRTRGVDELWLDHDLAGDDDIWPVIRWLEEEATSDGGLSIGVIRIHASRSGPAHRMKVSLRRAGYLVERWSGELTWVHDSSPGTPPPGAGGQAFWNIPE